MKELLNDKCKSRLIKNKNATTKLKIKPSQDTVARRFFTFNYS